MGKWTADRGEVYYDGHHRLACWVEGNSIQPDHTLAIFVADLLNRFEDETGAVFTQPAITDPDPQPRPLLALLKMALPSSAPPENELVEWAAALEDEEPVGA